MTRCRLHPLLRCCLVALGVVAANFLASGVGLAADEGSGGGSGVDAAALIRLVVGLGVVLFLIVAMGWVMRRSGRFTGAAAGQLRVIGGVSVGSRERVVLVQVGEQQLLVGVAPGRVQTLHVLDEPLSGGDGTPDASRHPGSQVSPFAQRLRQMMQPDEKRQQ